MLLDDPNSPETPLPDDLSHLVTSSPVPAPSTRRPRTQSSGRQDLDDLYETAGNAHNVDPDLLVEQGRIESVNFNPRVIAGRLDSPVGAKGIAQFMPDTARHYGLNVGGANDDRTNPAKAIDAQARMMRDLLDKHKDNVEAALAAYNSGSNLNTDRALHNRQRIPETRLYVDKITGALKSTPTANTRVATEDDLSGVDLSHLVSQEPASASVNTPTDALPPSDESLGQGLPTRGNPGIVGARNARKLFPRNMTPRLVEDAPVPDEVSNAPLTEAARLHYQNTGQQGLLNAQGPEGEELPDLEKLVGTVPVNDTVARTGSPAAAQQPTPSTITPSPPPQTSSVPMRHNRRTQPRTSPRFTGNDDGFMGRFAQQARGAGSSSNRAKGPIAIGQIGEPTNLVPNEIYAPPGATAAQKEMATGYRLAQERARNTPIAGTPIVTGIPALGSNDLARRQKEMVVRQLFDSGKATPESIKAAGLDVDDANRTYARLTGQRYVRNPGFPARFEGVVSKATAESQTDHMGNAGRPGDFTYSGAQGGIAGINNTLANILQLSEEVTRPLSAPGRALANRLSASDQPRLTGNESSTWLRHLADEGHRDAQARVNVYGKPTTLDEVFRGAGGALPTVVSYGLFKTSIASAFGEAAATPQNVMTAMSAVENLDKPAKDQFINALLAYGGGRVFGAAEGLGRTKSVAALGSYGATEGQVRSVLDDAFNGRPVDWNKAIHASVPSAINTGAMGLLADKHSEGEPSRSAYENRLDAEPTASEPVRQEPVTRESQMSDANLAGRLSQLEQMKPSQLNEARRSQLEVLRTEAVRRQSIPENVGTPTPQVIDEVPPVDVPPKAPTAGEAPPNRIVKEPAPEIRTVNETPGDAAKPVPERELAKNEVVTAAALPARQPNMDRHVHATSPDNALKILEQGLNYKNGPSSTLNSAENMDVASLDDYAKHAVHERGGVALIFDVPHARFAANRDALMNPERYGSEIRKGTVEPKYIKGAVVNGEFFTPEQLRAYLSPERKVAVGVGSSASVKPNEPAPETTVTVGDAGPVTIAKKDISGDVAIPKAPIEIAPAVSPKVAAPERITPKLVEPEPPHHSELQNRSEVGKFEPGMKPDERFANNKIFTNDVVAQARARIRAKAEGKQLNTGLDPELAKDYALIGAAHIEAGARRFGDWSKNMVEEFGESIKPHLDKIYKASRDAHDFEREPVIPETKVKTPEGIRQHGATMRRAGIDAPDVEYDPQTVPGWKRDATATINEMGVDKAIRYYKDLPDGDQGGKYSLGDALLDRLKPGTAEYTDVARHQIEHAGEAGQTLRAAAEVSRRDPANAVKYTEMALQRTRKRGLTPEEAERVQKRADRQITVEADAAKLDKQLDGIITANPARPAEGPAEVAGKETKPRKANAQRESKPSKITYEVKIQTQGQAALAALRAKAGKLELGPAPKVGERGAVRVEVGEIPELKGDAELIAQYAASRLPKLESIDALNTELRTEFGPEIEPHLKDVRQRALSIRAEARRAEIAESDKPRQQTLIQEIRKELQAAHREVKEAERYDQMAQNAVKNVQAAQMESEAKGQAKEALAAERAAQDVFEKDANARRVEFEKTLSAIEKSQAKRIGREIQAKKDAVTLDQTRAKEADAASTKTTRNFEQGLRKAETDAKTALTEVRRQLQADQRTELQELEAGRIRTKPMRASEKQEAASEIRKRYDGLRQAAENETHQYLTDIRDRYTTERGRLDATARTMRAQAAREAKELATAAREQKAQLQRELNEARKAEVKGYRERIGAERTARKAAGRWDAALRQVATEARERLPEKVNPKDPAQMEDLISVGTEKFLNDSRLPTITAISPARFYREMAAEFPDLSTRQIGSVYRRALENARDATKAAREVAQVRGATTESRTRWEKFWEGSGIDGEDISAQAILIQRANKAKELLNLRREQQQELNRLSRSVPGVIWDDWIHGPTKSLRSTIDSMLGRQGLQNAVLHPIITAKGAFPETWSRETLRSPSRLVRSILGGYAMSKGEFARAMRAIENHPRKEMAEAMGVDLPQVEEQFNQNVVSGLPHVRLSEQAATLQMTGQRLGMVDYFARLGEGAGYTPESNPEFYKQAGRIINIGTGRGDLDPSTVRGRIASASNRALFSGKLAASRFQLINDVLNPVSWIKNDPVIRKYKAIQLLKLGVVTLGTYAAANALGAKVGLNPFEKDFGKLRSGNARYDLTAGNAGAVRLLASLTLLAYNRATGEKLPYGQDSPWPILGQQLRYKLGPVPALIYDTTLGGQKNAVGEPIQYIPDPHDLAGTAQHNAFWNLISPMVLGDFVDGWEDDGLRGMLKALPALGGLGVATYPDKSAKGTKPKPTPAERVQRRQANREKRTEQRRQSTTPSP